MKNHGEIFGRNQVRAGRAYDPVFWCMVIAMVLAVASSVTLRAVMAGNTGEAPAMRMPAAPLPPTMLHSQQRAAAPDHP